MDPAADLLKWSRELPASDVQDPLGVGLRGAARLSNLLLFCITSVTPRARYYSFLPWCVEDAARIDPAGEVRAAVAVREKLLTLGSVSYHGGDSCDGGSLIGVRQAQKILPGRAAVELRSADLGRTSALATYRFSLVNLGLLRSGEPPTDPDETDGEEETAEHVPRTIELTDLGERVAGAYGRVVSPVRPPRLSSGVAQPVSELAKFGERGCLCGVSVEDASDRPILEDLLFARIGFTGRSHARRRDSLVLLLDLSRQLGDAGLPLDERTFAHAVYRRRVTSAESTVEVRLHRRLEDVAERWRMFQLHHFLGVALEGMFSWVVTNLGEGGVGGMRVGELLAYVSSPAAAGVLSGLAKQEVFPDPAAFSPAGFFSAVGNGDPAGVLPLQAPSLGPGVDPALACGEFGLEEAVKDRRHLHSPGGLIAPAALLALTLVRTRPWLETPHGRWLSSDAVLKDPYLDLLPPTVLRMADTDVPGWWDRPWRDLVEFAVRRCVVRQHITLSYEKTAEGDRCLLAEDGDRLWATGSYDTIRLGNARLPSALRILTDLGLLDPGGGDEPARITDRGLTVLDAELREAA